MKLTDNLLTSRFPPIHNEDEFWDEVKNALDMHEDWEMLTNEILLAMEAGDFHNDHLAKDLERRTDCEIIIMLKYEFAK